MKRGGETPLGDGEGDERVREGGWRGEGVMSRGRGGESESGWEKGRELRRWSDGVRVEC